MGVAALQWGTVGCEQEAPIPALMCVHPHPDDESIACGGTLARYADEGHRTMVVTCTGGEEGENLAGIDLGGVEMTEVRERELAAALATLGVERHAFLGYRDSGMAGTPANEHPDSFLRADLEEAAHRLAAIVRDFRPDVVVSDNEDGSYGHPDHVKANRVTSRALAVAADPAADVAGSPWKVEKRYVHAIPRTRLAELHRRLLAAGHASPFGDEEFDSPADVPFGVPDENVTTVVDVGDWMERKQAAMRAHASQIGEESFFLNLPVDLAGDVFGREYFVLVSGSDPASEAMEDDLFTGLRESR